MDTVISLPAFAERKKAKKGKTKSIINKGFSLIEFVIVVSLISLMILGVAIMLKKGKQASSQNTTLERINIISAGISELKLYRGNLPAQAVMAGTSFPASLSAYIPTEFQNGGAYEFDYQCDAGGADRPVLQTPAYDSVETATNIKTQFVDAGVCDATSTLTGSALNCVLTSFTTGPCL